MNTKQINAILEYDCMTKDLYHGEFPMNRTRTTINTGRVRTKLFRLIILAQ